MDTKYDKANSRMLDIWTTTSDGATSICMAGEADITTHEQLRATLATVDTGGRRVDLRLSGLDFCDVTTAWELLELVREAKQNGSDVRVVDEPNKWVRTILRILDVEDDLALPPGPEGHRGDDSDGG